MLILASNEDYVLLGPQIHGHVVKCGFSLMFLLGVLWCICTPKRGNILCKTGF